jgi:hypothetical protein
MNRFLLKVRESGVARSNNSVSHRFAKAIFALVLLLYGNALASGNWLKLANTAPDSVSCTLLLTDGTVMAANNPDDITGDFGKKWYRLTPDPNGH